MSNYIKQIELKFQKYGYIPREKQVDIINNILIEYIDNGHKNVVLSASTGIGKSLIALFVSEILHDVSNNNKKDKLKNSFIVAHTNTLIQQYEDSYSNAFDMMRVNGAVNYVCGAQTKPGFNATGEECVPPSDRPKHFAQHCGGCSYNIMKQKLNTVPHIISNYAYIFTSLLYSNHLDKRLLTVWDECHNINDVYTSFLKIETKIKTLSWYSKECRMESVDVYKKFDEFVEFLENGDITDRNYPEYLDMLEEAYEDAHNQFRELAYIERSDENYPAYKKLNTIAKKYGNLYKKIEDFFDFKYEHVTDIKPDSIEISPIFMNGMFDKVDNSKYHLFMSATIDQDMISETLGIGDVGFVYGGSIFDPNNKNVIDCKLPTLNYKNMQDSKFMKPVYDEVNSIVEEYFDVKGIIIVSSFAQLQTINEKLSTHLKKNKVKVKIFAQNRGEKLKDVLADFLEYKKPSVLISPAIHEAVSFDHDLARYIVMFKASYPSLGDKRWKYILNNYPNLYNKTTLYKIIQGIGRGVRDVDDYCDIFLIDGKIKQLLKSKDNIWVDEYKKYIR